MPDWEYKSTSCRNGSITETWQVYCSDDDESVCKSLGCHAILNDLVGRSAATTPAHGDRDNPGLTAAIIGLGYPYRNRPCDLNDPTGLLFLDTPEIDGNVQTFNQRCCKTVRLTWKPRPDGNTDTPQQQDDDTAQETDQWCPQISSSTVERIEAARLMVFGGKYQASAATTDAQDGCCAEVDAANLNDMAICDPDGTGGARTLEIGKCYTPQASNGQPYPALEVRKTDRSYRLKIWRACKPDEDNAGQFLPFDETVFDGWTGVTNCNEFTLSIACRCWQRTFKPRTLMIASIATDPDTLSFTDPFTGAKLDYPLMCVTFELVHRAETWDVDLLDAGTLMCPDPDDDPPEDPLACLPQEVITDPNGWAVDHETPLNGIGGCLPLEEREWYTRWRAKCRTFDASLPTLGTYIS